MVCMPLISETYKPEDSSARSCVTEFHEELFVRSMHVNSGHQCLGATGGGSAGVGGLFVCNGAAGYPRCGDVALGLDWLGGAGEVCLLSQGSFLGRPPAYD